MSISIILFDFGGVIQTPLEQDAVETRREQLATRLGFPSGEVMWQRFYGGSEWQATKTGRMTDAEMWSALLSPLGLTTRPEQAAFVEELYEGEGLGAEMAALIAELHGRYRLAILSNASDTLEHVLENKLQILGLFDAVVNSHRIGVAKPNAGAYQAALRILAARAQEVFFVDDQERNAAAAEELGIASHIFTDVARLRIALDRLSLREA